MRASVDVLGLKDKQAVPPGGLKSPFMFGVTRHGLFTLCIYYVPPPSRRCQAPRWAKAVELAKSGDTQILKFLLNRILPRDRAVKVELPAMEYADDAVDALGAIARAISDGKISPTEGAALAAVVNAQARAIDLADVVKRLEAIEGQLRGYIR